MSRTVTLELPDHLFEAVQRAATRNGQPVEAYITEAVAREASLAPGETKIPSGAEIVAATERLRRHFGVWDSGDPHGSDNSKIDADLARAYGQALEPDA